MMSRGLSANQRLVIEYMRENKMTDIQNMITVTEIAKVIGKVRHFPRAAEFGMPSHGTTDEDRKSIFRMMKSLTERGLIERSKPPKWRGWRTVGKMGWYLVSVDKRAVYT